MQFYIRRIPLISLILSCSIVTASMPSPNTYGFSKPPEKLELLQLAAAALSIPATIAANEYQDSNLLACVESGLKATYALLALFNQTSGNLATLNVQTLSYNEPWFIWDSVQTVKSLIATFKAQPEAQPSVINLGKDHQLTPQAKRAIGIILASVEGAMRILSTLINDQPKTDEQRSSLRNKQEFFNSIGSLVRLANMYLHAKNDDRNALLIALVLANFVLIPVQGFYLKGSLAASEKPAEEANLKPAETIKTEKKAAGETPKQAIPQDVPYLDALDLLEAQLSNLGPAAQAENKPAQLSHADTKNPTPIIADPQPPQSNNDYQFLRNNLGNRKRKPNDAKKAEANQPATVEKPEKDKDKEREKDKELPKAVKVDEKKEAKIAKKQEAKQEEPQCLICLDPLKLKRSEATPCGHVFHEACLHKWITMQPQNAYRKDHGNKQATCPACNMVLVEKAAVIDDDSTDEERRIIEEAAGNDDL